MYRLDFALPTTLLDEKPFVLAEMNDWLKANGCTPVTSDTMVWNQLNGNIYRYYRLRASISSDHAHVITFSHPNDLIHFKLMWSDYWV